MFRCAFKKDSAHDIAYLIEVVEMHYFNVLGISKHVISPLDTEIDFNEKGQAERYLLYGVSFTEERGVWSRAEVCSRAFRVDARCAAQVRNLRLRLRGYVQLH